MLKRVFGDWMSFPTSKIREEMLKSKIREEMLKIIDYRDAEIWQPLQRKLNSASVPYT
jgi:hypothetical protein